jgi:hypothetical protein
MTCSAYIRSYVRALRWTFFIFPSLGSSRDTLAYPFDRPGQADLTANVDFVYLDKALKGTVLVITCRVSDEGTVFSLRL